MTQPTTTTLGRAINQYVDRRLVNLSAGSIERNLLQLRKFEQWVYQRTQQQVYLTAVDDDMMLDYFKQYRPGITRYEPGTFNQYRTVHSQFWKYCVAKGWVFINPMSEIVALDVPEKARLRLSADELMAMLDEADDPRDRVALAMGMNTGLRAGDITRLKISAVNLGDNSLTVYIRKTKKTDVLPVTAELREELFRWFDAYAKMMGLPGAADLNDSWTLVPPYKSRLSGKGRNVKGLNVDGTYQNFQEVVHRALTKRGLPLHDEHGKSYNYGIHVLRRSAGRIMHDKAATEGTGSAIRVAGAFLGHASQAATEIYLGITHDRELRDKMLRGQSFLPVAAKQNRDLNAKLDNPFTERRRSA